MKETTKKIITALGILVTSIGTNSVNAQTNEILVGHQMPEVKMNSVLNYKNADVNISDFKGKLLILDFWATYCAPCVSMFGRTDSLQKIFNGKIQFLSVTKEPARKVQPFLDRMYRMNKIKPISVVGDTILSRYFYYASIPYYVWINSNGKVIATTDADEITAENIESVINGKSASFENRRDIRRKAIDYTKSLFVVSDNFVLKDSSRKREVLQRPDILSYSIATRWIDNAQGGFSFDPDHFNGFNVSIDYLYRMSYDLYYYASAIPGAFDSQTTHVFEMPDSLLNKITVPDNSPINGNSAKTIEWGKKYGASYEIVFPKGISWKEKIKQIKSDLDRYFAIPMGFEVVVEKRTDTNTTALKILNGSKLSTVGGRSFEKHDRYFYSQQNEPLATLIRTMNSYFLQGAKTTIVNKTNFEKKVDLQLNCDMTNLNEVNKELLKFGLSLIKEPTAIDVLVFKGK
ncbi:Thiol-disulfide isomerase or thioredoxin [Mucilaginibacter pineti]|uniref:Thiol-disulfide isomerase or thioredoxin n=1 Tax=Mucilaginibacter pineti TaxID=1391627 RepID=A0A1G7L9Q5_9SPHI|nr:TlpA disulfide reductase family protein [Mucilaginibacter pineti]SDF45760.1 Thiol-disulfide isomerase or thioredoxin [Mucilaginibacter pineti]